MLFYTQYVFIIINNDVVNFDENKISIQLI
jgi:hypothetical protein